MILHRLRLLNFSAKNSQNDKVEGSASKPAVCSSEKKASTKNIPSVIVEKQEEVKDSVPPPKQTAELCEDIPLQICSPRVSKSESFIAGDERSEYKIKQEKSPRYLPLPSSKTHRRNKKFKRGSMECKEIYRRNFLPCSSETVNYAKNSKKSRKQNDVVESYNGSITETPTEGRHNDRPDTVISKKKRYSRFEDSGDNNEGYSTAMYGDTENRRKSKRWYCNKKEKIPECRETKRSLCKPEIGYCAKRGKGNKVCKQCKQFNINSEEWNTESPEEKRNDNCSRYLTCKPEIGYCARSGKKNKPCEICLHGVYDSKDLNIETPTEGGEKYNSRCSPETGYCARKRKGNKVCKECKHYNEKAERWNAGARTESRDKYRSRWCKIKSKNSIEPSTTVEGVTQSKAISLGSLRNRFLERTAKYRTRVSNASNNDSYLNRQKMKNHDEQNVKVLYMSKPRDAPKNLADNKAKFKNKSHRQPIKNDPCSSYVKMIKECNGKRVFDPYSFYEKCGKFRRDFSKLQKRSRKKSIPGKNSTVCCYSRNPCNFVKMKNRRKSIFPKPRDYSHNPLRLVTFSPTGSSAEESDDYMRICHDDAFRVTKNMRLFRNYSSDDSCCYSTHSRISRTSQCFGKSVASRKHTSHKLSKRISHNTHHLRFQSPPANEISCNMSESRPKNKIVKFSQLNPITNKMKQYFEKYNIGFEANKGRFFKNLALGLAFIAWFPCIAVMTCGWILSHPLKPQKIATYRAKQRGLKYNSSRQHRLNNHRLSLINSRIGSFGSRADLLVNAFHSITRLKKPTERRNSRQTHPYNTSRAHHRRSHNRQYTTSPYYNPNPNYMSTPENNYGKRNITQVYNNMTIHNRENTVNDLVTERLCQKHNKRLVNKIRESVGFWSSKAKCAPAKEIQTDKRDSCDSCAKRVCKSRSSVNKSNDSVRSVRFSDPECCVPTPSMSCPEGNIVRKSSLKRNLCDLNTQDSCLPPIRYTRHRNRKIGPNACTPTLSSAVDTGDLQGGVDSAHIIIKKVSSNEKCPSKTKLCSNIIEENKRLAEILKEQANAIQEADTTRDDLQRGLGIPNECCKKKRRVTLDAITQDTGGVTKTCSKDYVTQGQRPLNESPSFIRTQGGTIEGGGAIAVIIPDKQLKKSLSRLQKQASQDATAEAEPRDYKATASKSSMSLKQSRTSMPKSVDLRRPEDRYQQMPRTSWPHAKSADALISRLTPIQSSVPSMMSTERTKKKNPRFEKFKRTKFYKWFDKMDKETHETIFPLQGKIQCRDMYMFTLKKRPFFWIYKKWPRLYPEFLRYFYCYKICCNQVLLATAFCIWTPILLCCYACYITVFHTICCI